MKINITWNPLSIYDGHTEIEVPDGLTPNQILKEAQLVFKRPFILVLCGECLSRKEWDTRIISAKDEPCFIEIPGISGLGSLITTLILSQFSTASILGMSSAAVFGLQAVGSILSTGLVLGGLHLVNRFLAGSPKTPTSIGQNDQLYEVSSGNNRSRLNSPFPEHFGYLKVYPEAARHPFVRYGSTNTFLERVDQYFYFVGIVGIGQYEIGKVCIGDTDISEMNNAIVRIIAPGETSIFVDPGCVYPCDTISGTQLNEMYKDNKSCQCIVNPSGTQIDHIEWDLSYPSGAFYASGSGSFNSDAGLTFRTLVRKVDDNGNAISDWTPIVTKTDKPPYPIQGSLNDGFYYIRAYSTSQLRTTVRYPVPTSLGPGRYEFFMQGVGRNSSPKFVNTCVIGQVRGISSTLIQTLDDVTQIEIKVRADAQVTGAVADQINLIAFRKLYPVTSTGFGSTLAATRSIADAIAYIVTTENGGKQPNALIDWESLAALRTIWENKGWHFDYRAQTRMSVMEACALAARCGRAMPYMPGKFLIVMDDEKSTASMKFTVRDYTEGSFKMSHNLRTADDPTGIEVHCIDWETWSDAIIECYDEDGSDENLAVVELPGVISKQHGYDLGMYMYLDDKLNRTDVEFACGLKGHIPLPGDRIMIDIPAADGWNRAGVIQKIVGTNIHLSESIEWGTETTGILYLTNSIGTLIGPYTVTPGIEDYIVIGSLPIDTKTVITDANEATQYLFAFSADETTTMRITCIEPSGQNDVRLSGTIYGALAYVSPGTAPIVEQGLLDSISLSYQGVVNNEYSYICGWSGSAESVRIELDEGTGYIIKQDEYTAATYSFTVASATSISLKITPYNIGVLSPDDAIIQAHQVPGTVTNLILVGEMGESWEISWDAVTGADQYCITIFVEGDLVGNMNETSTGRSFTIDDMIGWGGPYDSWSVHVAAEIDGEVGKPDTLDLTYTAWDPTGLTAEPGIGTAFLSITYTKTNSFEACEIWISETNDLSTAYKCGETGGSTYLAIGLEDGKTYYFWVRVRLGVGIYTGWYPISDTAGVECEIDYIPDAVEGIAASATAEGVEISWIDSNDSKNWHYKITEGATYETSTEIGRNLGSPYVIKFPGPGTVLSIGSKTFWVILVSSSGTESPATNSTTLTIYSPYTPVIYKEWNQDVLRLSWSDCKRTLEIDYYEVQHYITSEGVGTAKVDKVKGLFAQYKIDWQTSKTFMVRAVDKAGNAGDYDTEVVSDPISGYAVTSATVAAVGDGLRVSWTNITATPVKEYRVSVGSIFSSSIELGRTQVSPFVLTWPFSTKLSSGSNRFWIVGFDFVGNQSNTAYKDFSISLPATPSVTVTRSKDVVRFTWADCKTTFDIDNYRIEATIGAVTTIDKVVGLVAEYKLEWIGTKTFKFYAVDKAGFQSSSYDSESITVSAVGAPTALTATGGVYEVAISVTFPTNEYFAGCEIWAATSNNRTYAKKIAELSSTENPATAIHKLKATLNDSWYFWAKSKDIYGNYSTWYPVGSTSGVAGAPSTNPEDYLNAITGHIDYDDFVASLQTALGTDVGGNWTYYAGEGYSLHINENGNITGWRNFIDIDAPEVSTFDIWANKFRIVNYNSEGQIVTPFVVGTVGGIPSVGVNGNLIVDGTILGRHIKATETITLNNAGKLSIGTNGSIEIGVGGSITILGSMTGYDQIADAPDSLSDINSTEGSKLNNGLDANGNVIRNISGPLLPTANPTAAGIYINQNYLGYWSGSAWNSYIAATGQFQFLGNALNKITWNGSVLDVRGALVADDIISGTLSCANVKISLAGGVEVTGNQGITVDDGADITLDNTDSIDPAKIIFRELDGGAEFSLSSYFSALPYERSTLLLAASGISNRELVIDGFSYTEIGGDSDSQLALGGSTSHAALQGKYYVSLKSYNGAITTATAGLELISNAAIAWGTGDSVGNRSFIVQTASSMGSGVLFYIKSDGTVSVKNNIIPTSSGTLDLGSSSYAFNVAYIKELNNPTGEQISVTDSIVPKADATYDLGTSSYKFENGYINNIYSERVEQSAADAFQIKLSADQSNLSIGSYITVKFASETNDHTNAFNTSTYTYTAQGNGWRQFNVNLFFYQVDSAATNITVELVTSNETFQWAYEPATSQPFDGHIAICGSQLAYMDNGDTAYVRVYITGGTAQADIASVRSCFSGFFVND